MEQPKWSTLIETYRLYRKMMRFPQLVEDMRELFLEALEKKGVINREALHNQACQVLVASGEAPSDDAVADHIDALIDLYFATHFDPQEAENYINLARKNDRFRILNIVVNTEGASPWKIRQALRDFCAIPQGDLYISPTEAEGVRVALIHQFISTQLPFIGVAKKHITIRDVDEMLDHTYSTRRRPGRIGGKAAGFALANKIVLPRLVARDPDFEKHIAVTESYYLSSGIFSDFLDFNKLHHLHSFKYQEREAIEEHYRGISRQFAKAAFPPDVMTLMAEVLEKIGEHPLVLRSSSLLEDSFGYAFSGKYDSVFVANRGDPAKRLAEFMWGLKKVHMSTFAPAPILYRRDHKLLDFDERMSVLVQKVVGRQRGDAFFPFAAGVAFSHNAYAWSPRIRKSDGLLRIVLGLGTRAVDRVSRDYPRMIPLSHPELRPELGARQIAKYSQNMVDVLNLESGELESRHALDVLPQLTQSELYQALSVERDGHLAPPMFKSQSIDLQASCITFDNLIAHPPFIGLMRKVLRTLEDAYGHPIDVEFAWDGDRLYLLQCRSLSMREEVAKVAVPEDVPEENVLFANHRVMANAIVHDIEYVVYVDPRAYNRLSSYEEMAAVGHVVSRCNRFLDGRRYALFGPGRWGSNDIRLGVRVTYGDINRTAILGEIAFAADDSTPEVSYGTHFFNDLVEARIIPVAVFPDDPEALFNEAFLLQAPNALGEALPELAAHDSVVRLIDVPRCTGGRFLHVYQDANDQRGLGFFAHRHKDAPVESDSAQGE